MKTLACLLLLWACAPLLADAGADYRAIVAASDSKKHAEALRLSENFLKQYPDHESLPAVLYLGGAAGLAAREYGRAEPLYRKLLADFPQDTNVPRARDELASVLRDARKLEACLTLLDENLKVLPKDARAERWAYLRGECLFRLWRFDDARKELEAFKKAWPKSSLAKSADRYLADIDPPWTIDACNVIQDYDGKYAGDARLEAARRKLPAYTREAVEVLRERLGVDISGHLDVVFRFRDKGSNRDGERAVTTTVGRKNKPWMVMTFYTEFVVLDEEDHHSRVIHELKHAGFRGIMGQKYLDLPKWIREGLAVYGAGQLPERMPLILSNEVFGSRDPVAVLDGIDEPDKDHNTIDYLEDALFFEWLDAACKGGTAAFCRRLVKGEDYKTILADLCKQPWEKLMAQAEDHCRRRVEDVLGKGHKAYSTLRGEEAAAERKGKEALSQWLEKTGVAAYENWLKDHKGHLCEPLALYRLGKGLVTLGRHEEGRVILARVRDQYGRCSTVNDDAAYQYALSFELAGDEEGARREFGLFLRDYSWSAGAAEAAKKYKAAGPQTPGDEAESED